MVLSGLNCEMTNFHLALIVRTAWFFLEKLSFICCVYFLAISAELQQVIRSSMNSAYEDRPNIDTLLMTPKVQAILAQRKRFLPLKRIAVSTQNPLKKVSNLTCSITEGLSKINRSFHLPDIVQISKTFCLAGFDNNICIQFEIREAITGDTETTSITASVSFGLLGRQFTSFA